MSRVGKYPVAVPAGVQVALQGRTVVAKGKLGELKLALTDEVDVEIEDNQVAVKPRRDDRRSPHHVGHHAQPDQQHGATASPPASPSRWRSPAPAIAPRCRARTWCWTSGFSHEVRYPIPDGIKITCERPTAVKVDGADKRQVGQVAAEIRACRGPEPYKGKGVRYTDEQILRKEGKKK